MNKESNNDAIPEVDDFSLQQIVVNYMIKCQALEDIILEKNLITKEELQIRHDKINEDLQEALKKIIDG